MKMPNSFFCYTDPAQKILNFVTKLVSSENETQNLHKFLTLGVCEQFEDFISCHFDKYGLQIMKNRNSFSENESIT